MSGASDNIVLAAAAVSVGAAVQSVLGFGCSLVCMSVFPLFTTVPDAVGVLQPLALAVNVLVLLRTYHHAAPRELRPLALTMPVGIIVGLWVVTTWPAWAMNGLLGVFLLAYTFLRGGKEPREDTVEKRKMGSRCVRGTEEGDYDGSETSPMIEQTTKREEEHFVDSEVGSAEAVMQTNSSPSKLQPQHISSPINHVALAAGFFGGCLHSAFGTGGPPVLVFAHEAGWESRPESFRANLQVVLLSMNVLAISSQAAAGIITAETLRTTALLMPAVVAGTVAGSKLLAPRIPQERFRALVVNGLRIMGMMFVSKAVR